MDEYKKINKDSFHHRSSSAKCIKSNNNKKNSNINVANEFTKINTLASTNTSGTQPIIIYKKGFNNNNIKQIKIPSNNSNSNNVYICDGGLKNKLERYNGGHSYSIPNKKSSSVKNGKKVKKFYPTKKKLLKSSTQEKLFSQTMIGSFKRPNIPKKEKKNKIKNSNINENKEKNKENKKYNKPIKNQQKNLSGSCMVDLENKKIERMNKLVENAIVYEMRKNQIEKEKQQITLKDKISLRKNRYLQNNGIETTDTIDEVPEYDIDKKIEKDEKKDKNENNNNNIEEKKIKLKKKPKSDINSNSHTINVGSSNFYNINNYNYLINSNEDEQLTLDITKKKKKILKPKVNQFEFIQKIQEEKKKLPFHIETSNHNKRQLNKNLSTSSKINDSFRHKSITIKSNENNKINSSDNNIFDINDSKRKKYTTIQFQENTTENTDDFPFATKKNNRKAEELNEFIKRKKIKAKKEEENKEYEKKKKLFEIFKNLSNLKDSYSSNNYTNINNSISIFKRKNKKNLLKHKEVNAYYIGTDSSRNGSTILDLNEYYLNILESQQLLVNSGFNKISDLSLSNEDKDKENDKNNNDMYFDLKNNNEHNNFIYGNYNNEELRQINNILKNDGDENEPIEYINDTELNNKINDTLKRASNIISQKDIEEENINLDEIQNNNENKEINKENEKQKNNNYENKIKEKKIENINLGNINLDNINNKNNINTTSEFNTKEKNLPSLPHTFSNNSNPNKKVEIEIQPCAVLNLVEIIRLIIQRKVFFKLCQLYINHSFSQRYIIAFSYFVAICKQFPFKTIEDYCNYKTYYYAFRQLFRPFIRKNFKKFLNNCISITKIGYFVELLSRMFKFKSMERIYIYSQLKEENDQLKAVCGIIMKILLTLIRPHLEKYFRELCDKLRKNRINGKDKDKPSLNIDIDTFELSPVFHKKKNNSTRINSFMYESFDSKSNYSVHPNSVDNDILHRLQNYIIDKNKINKLEKNKLSKNLKDGLFCDDDSNKSQENLYHPKRNNNIKINFLNPQNINENNKKPNKKNEKKNNINNNDEIKNKNNLILDIKKEDTNEFSPINKNNINNKDNNKDNNKKNNKNEEKIKIEKIKIIKTNNQEGNDDLQNEQNNINDINVINDIDTNNNNINKDKNQNQNNIEIKKDKNDFLEKQQTESDISADKDYSNNNIIWEYALSPSNININDENNENNEENKNNDLNNKIEEKKENNKEDKIEDKKEILSDKKNKENNTKEKEKDEEIIKEETIKEKEAKIIEEENNKNKNDNKDKEKEKENEKDENKKDNEDNFDIEEILLSDPENNKDIKNKKKEENKENIINIKKNLENNSDKNKNQALPSLLDYITFQKEEENIIINENENEKENDKKEKQLLKELPEKVYDDLTEEIVKELIDTEIIKNNINLLPTKTYKFDKYDINLSNNFLNNSSSINKENNLKDGSIATQNSLTYRDNSSFPNFYLNESIISSFSASSIFNKTVKDKKKEKSLLLYLKKIAPILIKYIQEEIYIKYPRIYDNISIPLKNNYKEIMVALELQNGEMIRNNYKRKIYKEEIKDIIDKEKILKKLEPINKEIRNNDNIFDDNYYDKMINECIIDTVIEIIKKERIYGEDGEPLPWGGRTRELIYKYDKNNPKKFIEHVTEELINILNTKIGLINTNYEYLSQEQLNIEKEKRLIKTLKNELKEQEEHWNNLEIEETQLKIEITEIINEQLYNEVMEILEHIALSRKRPELYQNKSIFVCEEIPKLSFQQNTTENKGMYNGEENDLINIE